ncbi:MAG TPA: transglycosylase domain-containing protein [Frankiaceae bacterium]|nr:transglycosylase domain-containing protein [Frankiaceae bacterium]
MSTATAAARKRRPGRHWLSRKWNGLTPRGKKLIGGGILALFLAFVGMLGAVYAAADIPLPSELDRAQATVIEYSDGSTMGQIAKENRTDIALADVPPHVRDAVIAAEDRSYYEHSGISVSGIARAAYHDVRGGGAKQGGSTITQQYARNAFLNRQRTFARKFREAVIAVKLDRKYSKDQVLEWYLNTIYFGRGAYGVEAAAQTYFGVPAKRLTVEQGALLAALIRSPEGGDPALNRETAERRWNGVLDGMVETKKLDAGKRAGARFPNVKPRKAVSGKKDAGGAGPTGYVIEAVRKELLANGFTEDQILTGGLRVRTTIDRRRQDAAVKAVQGVLDDPAHDPAAALVAVEPGTGKVVAMYGGRDYGGKGDKSFINYAYNRRQPGSSFKPFVLAAALDEGISLRSRYDGRSPQVFANYPVRNFDNEQFGRIDLVVATAHSVNTVYVPLGMEVGFEKTMDMVHRLGVSEKVTCEANKDATLYLGTCDLSPVDSVTAFATFAAKGQSVAPHLVSEVRDRKGKKTYTAKADKSEALSEGEAADATYALRAVVENGTARRAQIGRPAAGKTGTTSDNTDAWFSGFVPQLAATVWMGYEPREEGGKAVRPPLRGVQGVGEVTGGSLPATIWHEFMTAALEGVPVEDFPPPVFGGKTENPEPSPSATSGSPTPSVTPSVTVSVTVAPTQTAVTEQPTVIPTTSEPTSEPPASPSATTSESPPAPSSEPSQQPPPDGGGEGGSG